LQHGKGKILQHGRAILTVHCKLYTVKFYFKKLLKRFCIKPTATSSNKQQSIMPSLLIE